MTSLPEKKRPRPILPARRSVAARVLDVAGAAAFHVLHPALRERFVEAARPGLLTRVEYRTDDGWTSPLHYLPPRPGGAGEPVVLAHAAGVSADAFRYGVGRTLAGELSRRGFAVYLLHHRGDRSSRGPTQTRVDFDAILHRDVPQALARVTEHSGYPRSHWIGHGVGGQLGAAWATQDDGRWLASVCVLDAPVRFSTPSSAARRKALALRLLPRHWEIPTRSLAQLSAPFTLADEVQDASHASGPRYRGLMAHAAEDIAVDLLRQIEAWIATGSLTSRGDVIDYTEALSAAAVPLLALSSDGQPGCRAILDTWGHPDRAHRTVDGYGALDLLAAVDAHNRVFEPVADWLLDRRRLAWGDQRQAI